MYAYAMPIPSDILTTREAAAALGLTPGGLRSAISLGHITVVKIDARTNGIPLEEIERYRREHLSGPGRRGRPRKHDDD